LANGKSSSAGPAVYLWGYDSHVVGGLEHDFYDFSDIGKNNPN
jgi:hypothetical protein